MFDDAIGWAKGLFGGAAEEVAQDAADLGGTAQGYGEAAFGEMGDVAQGYGEVGDLAQGYGETAFGETTEAAQGYGEAAFGEAAEAAQGFQDQVGAVGGFVEDPGGAVADAARDRLFDGEG
ncbi:hypothetical protein PWG71_08035 [Nocardiopsis sp. N85]|uniref:hypothetical protein n=1 Tax=Nocardiopsis sp. N85 TaxID=3029400 RepID=UPI00237F4F9B|nr:hypothetical protein [Nocardiopsis sp. N85]MDE3721335.1 hypothetical protein [Nocardiopsis sp. N85]